MKKSLIIVSIILAISLVFNLLLSISYLSNRDINTKDVNSLQFPDEFSSINCTVSDANSPETLSKEITQQYLDSMISSGYIKDYVFLDTSYISPINNGWYDFYVDVDVEPIGDFKNAIPTIFLTQGKRSAYNKP